jgi:hypothetical protein
MVYQKECSCDHHKWHSPLLVGCGFPNCDCRWTPVFPKGQGEHMLVEVFLTDGGIDRYTNATSVTLTDESFRVTHPAIKKVFDRDAEEYSLDKIESVRVNGQRVPQILSSVVRAIRDRSVPERAKNFYPDGSSD